MPYDWGRYTVTALKKFIDNASLQIVILKSQGDFLQFWLQVLNTFLVKRINDLVKKMTLPSLILLVPMTMISIPIIISNNTLIIVVNYLLKRFPKYPDYFPLEYLIIARKRK